MKNFKIVVVGMIAVLSLVACGSDDDDNSMPEIINEEEVITTLVLTFRSDLDGTAIEYRSTDADGDGPNPPVITNTGFLSANTSYSGTVQFLNETESPAENITEEVEEESDEHQVFFMAGSSLLATTTVDNTDSNGNPLGTEFSLETGDSSLGTYTVTLRHEPKKPNDGTLDDAGGETDIQVIFSLQVE